MAGKPWYNNGIQEIQIGYDEEIPDGYIRGRLPRTAEQREISLTKFRNTLINKSQEEKDLSNIKRSNSLKISYANKSDDEKRQIVARRVATMNSKSDEEKAAYRKRLSDSSIGKNKGKEPWNKGLTKDTDERVALNAEHTAKSSIERIKRVRESDPEYFNRWRSSINQKMHDNGTLNTSLQEENYYKILVSKYGEDGVIRQYFDRDRYPFNCDFYIPSEDLFIEYNKSWTHGGHPFDKLNLDDISKLEFWQEKAKTSKYYRNAIYTWTDLDVRKTEIAKKNNLNYKVIY